MMLIAHVNVSVEIPSIEVMDMLEKIHLIIYYTCKHNFVTLISWCQISAHRISPVGNQSFVAIMLHQISDRVCTLTKP